MPGFGTGMINDDFHMTGCNGEVEEGCDVFNRPRSEMPQVEDADGHMLTLYFLYRFGRLFFYKQHEMPVRVCPHSQVQMFDHHTEHMDFSAPMT